MMLKQILGTTSDWEFRNSKGMFSVMVGGRKKHIWFLRCGKRHVGMYSSYSNKWNAFVYSWVLEWLVAWYISSANVTGHKLINHLKVCISNPHGPQDPKNPACWDQKSIHFSAKIGGNLFLTHHGAQETNPGLPGIPALFVVSRYVNLPRPTGFCWRKSWCKRLFVEQLEKMDWNLSGKKYLSVSQGWNVSQGTQEYFRNIQPFNFKSLFSLKVQKKFLSGTLKARSVCEIPHDFPWNKSLSLDLSSKATMAFPEITDSSWWKVSSTKLFGLFRGVRIELKKDFMRKM